MKAFDPVCTSIMIEKPHGQYVRRDDMLSLMEAITECWNNQARQLEDHEHTVGMLQNNVDNLNEELNEVRSRQ